MKRKRVAAAEDNDEKRKKRTKNFHGFDIPVSCDTRVLPLNKLNQHERDGLIAFDEVPHLYYIYGQLGDYVSVTTFISSLFPKFESRKVALKMVSRGDFYTSRYKRYHQFCLNSDGTRIEDTNIIIDKILKEWDRNAKAASELGTALHNDCELFYNDIPNTENKSKEYGYFLKYAKDMEQQGFTPFRTEMRVFGEEEKICGSVDMLFKDNQGRIRLRDWKRSKSIRFSSFSNEYGCTPSTAHLQNCNMIKYSLQLALYAYLLEKYYGMPVYDMAIVVFHPSNKSYVEHQCLPVDIATILKQERRL
jgi:hypothetical protein